MDNNNDLDQSLPSERMSHILLQNKMLIIETVSGKTFYHRVQLTGGDGGLLGNKEVRLVAIAARHFAVGKIKYYWGSVS